MNQLNKFVSRLSKPAFSSPGAAKQGSAGFDNPRENIDPRIITKAVLGQEIWARTIDIDNSSTDTADRCLSIHQRGTTTGCFAINIDSWRQDDTVMVINSRMTAQHSAFKVRALAENTLGATIGAFQEVASSSGQCYYAYQAGGGNGLQIAMKKAGSTGTAIRIDNDAGVNTNFIQCNTSSGQVAQIDSTGKITGQAFAVGAQNGADGSFTTVDGKTVTVTKGIITSIV